MSPAALLVLLLLQQTLPGGLRGHVRSGGLEAGGAVVYLMPAGPDSSRMFPDTALIDQREIAFVPRVSVVGPGTTVLFRNSDPILHNVFSPAGPGAGFNLGTYPSPGAREQRFLEPGVHVILCHVHPEMLAFVIVVTTPYRTVVDQDGSFLMTGIPPGRYQLNVWRRRTAPLQQEIEIISGRTLERELELVPARHREE